jgi:hypothetical protein
MALTGAALVADAATGGMGGGMAVRVAAIGARAGTVGTAVVKAAIAVDRADTAITAVQAAISVKDAVEDGDVKRLTLSAAQVGLSVKSLKASGELRASRAVDDINANPKAVADVREGPRGVGDEGGDLAPRGGSAAGGGEFSRGGPPRQSGTGNYLPDPNASGPHTTLGTRVGSDGKPYTQGATFDKDGNFVGRTDVTNHGRSDHPKPHFHPAKGPASVKPGPHPLPDANDPRFRQE